jgi:hypothetical protein
MLYQLSYARINSKNIPENSPGGEFSVSFSILFRSGLSRWPATFRTHGNVHYVLDRDTQYRLLNCCLATDFLIELLHEQLPLPVPCYDLLPVNELTVRPHA